MPPEAGESSRRQGVRKWDSVHIVGAQAPCKDTEEAESLVPLVAGEV